MKQLKRNDKVLVSPQLYKEQITNMPLLKKLDVTGCANAIELLLRRTLVRSVVVWAFEKVSVIEVIINNLYLSVANTKNTMKCV